MASKLSTIETKLNEVFAEKAPKLPEGGKKFIVEWAPIISLVLGALSLIAAISLWNWAHAVNGAVDRLNTLCQAYGVTSSCGNTSINRLSFWVWLSLAVILVEGVLYILAYSGLKARQKKGWDYLFYGALVSLAYAVLSLFASYGGFGNFLGSLIGAAIGFYFLFQIRSFYTGVQEAKRVAPTASEPVEQKDTTANEPAEEAAPKKSAKKPKK